MSRRGVGLGSLASGEDHGSTGAQGDGEVLVQGLVQAEGEGWLGRFVDRHLIGHDGDFDQVALTCRLVSDRGADAVLAQFQLLELVRALAGNASQGLGNGDRIVDVDVVRRAHGDRAFRFTGFDGDGGAVSQGEGQAFVVGDRQRRVIADQFHGVGDLAAFGDGSAADRQLGGYEALRISHSDRSSFTDLQVLQLLTNHFRLADADGEFAFVLEHVIALGRCGVRLGGFASGEDQGSASAQGDGERLIQRLVQGDGEGRFGRFVDR